MLGGMARRAALVQKLRAGGHPVLVVDSGDLFFDARSTESDSKRALTKAKLIARAYKHMGATAINVGDLDLLYGLDFLRQEASNGLSLISANLLNPSDRKPIFSPYVIHKVSGVRIAFFGLLSPKLRLAIQKAVGNRVFVKDPLEVARETLLKLRDQADLVVLLSDTGLNGDRDVSKVISGIHFILGGHEARFIKWPHQEGGTFIVQSYKRGMYVGKLTLTVENPGSPFRDKAKTARLQEQIYNLDRRVLALQRAHKRHPNQTTGRTVQRINQQKAKLQEELKHSRKPSSTGNRFRWTLEQLNSSLPEDGEVRVWIREFGIARD